MRTFMLGLVCVLSLRPCSAQDQPIPPQEAASKFTMPAGFHATLFAGEPDIVQPISFTFDDRGRMWVVECLSYPKWTTEGTGHDRITILEDTDHDGKHDKKTVFYDQGANFSGVEYGFGGVWVTAIPYLLFIPDRNGDDVPDGPPEVILDGWDVKARHNVVNSPAWGPDGWLYGLNGILSNSSIGVPGMPEEKRVRMNCGVWRYHPTRKIVEAYAHGTTNPWGIDWDEYGELFITNCVIKHLFHVVPGGHYDRMFGQDINPHSYHLMPSIADHLHWAGGHWTISRGGQGLHSDAGGGHAHAGCMIYLGDNFPEEYRNNVFTLNIHGARLNRDKLEFDGSTYVAHHAPDFLFANDPWFRGLVVKYGPDGGVYFSDWTDTGECHNYDVADTSNGRIYKVVYGQPKKLEAFDLSKKTDQELVDLQLHKNEWWVRHARRLLQEKAFVRKIDHKLIDGVLLVLFHVKERPQALRLLWALNAMGAFEEMDAPSESKQKQASSVIDVEDLLGDHVAAWWFTLGVEHARIQDLDNDTWQDLTTAYTKTQSPRVLLALASAAPRLVNAGRDKDALAIVQNLAKRDLPADPYLHHMTWYAVESLVEKHRDEIVALLPKIKSTMVKECVARRITQMDGGPEQLLQLIAQQESAPWQADAVRGIVLALGGAARLKAPESWPAASLKLAELRDPASRQQVQTLALIFGDESARAELILQTVNTKFTPAERMQAIDLLVTDRAEALPEILLKLLDFPDVRPAAIRGLAAFHAPETPQAILSRYAKFTEAEKADAIQTLSERADWAAALLDAVQSGMVPRKEVSSLVVRQILALNKDPLKQKITAIWGEIKPASQQKQELTQKYRHQLTDDILAKADVMNGQAIFAKTCGSCHKLFGQGGSIGPELTGSQRTNLDYLLDNVLDPSAIVPREYQVTVLELESGRVVQGIVVEETNFGLTVQTPNERVSIPKDQIESRTGSNVSMMPEGLFDRLTELELRDLVGYLKK